MSVTILPVVEMEHISKTFPGVKALDDVRFSVFSGEVHVLLGENGAGKSTLMKILSGVYTKDTGEIRISGNPVELHNVKDAMHQGIRIIYQELNLLNNLTVAENIFIGEEPRTRGIIDWKKMFSESQKLLDGLNLSIDAHQKVAELPVGQQQMVEVAHAVSKEAKVIVMDEPTSALSSKEIKELFTTIRKLQKRGVGVVYISHRLEELLEIGDRVTVFRDGQYIGTRNVREEDGSIKIQLNDLITMMVGRSLDQQFPKMKFTPGEETLRIENLQTEEKLRGCSLSIRKGEILGLAGLMGAGRTELARAVIGADRITGGSVYRGGKRLKIRNPGDAIAQGIGYLPEDRKLHGLVLELDVAKNITLTGIKRIISAFHLSLKKERKEAGNLVGELRIKTPSISQQVRYLSGGNQQKVVVAKWLFANSDILIFDEPTRGIDVGAKVEIYRLLNTLVEAGKTVMIISSELPEILGMCDRIAVMREGNIVKEFLRAEATQDAILKYAIGAEA
jgi:ribose transport system ATP-binding protein